VLLHRTKYQAIDFLPAAEAEEKEISALAEAEAAVAAVEEQRSLDNPDVVAAVVVVP